MGTVKRLAEEVERGLGETHPGLRKTVIKKLALVVGAMLEGQTPNTVELANLLPLETERQDMREQWLRRLLKNPLLSSDEVIEPFARQELERAARHGQIVLLSLDQTELGNRMAVLMVRVRVGDRSLPLAGVAEAGAANIGFEGQRLVLERVRAWLPAGAEVLLSADRFYPSAALFEWLHTHGWRYRLRLKGNLLAEAGDGEERTTAEWARGGIERSLPGVRLFAAGVPTNLGIVHQAGHEEPWILAMECYPTRAAVLEYGARWGIEPLVSDFKSRGFDREDSRLDHPDRLERLMLLMSLAMSWCVRVGRDETMHRPTPLEKKLKRRPTQTTGASQNSTAA
jgi:hypothetical protein